MSTAGRDIISAAKVELAEGSSAKASQSRVARASGISATNTLQATAGHNITVGSAVTFMERHAKRLDESSTTNHGSAVAVGGNLAMTAGNDLTVAGSTVVAQNNAVLAAARNLSVTATQDTYSFHMRSSKEVISAPIVRYANNSSGISYIREVNVGVNIGFDKFNGNKPTSALTVFTDRFGNLLTSFPGIQE